MLIRKLDALRPAERIKSMSRPRGATACSDSFEIRRNGVLDHVMHGAESLVRDRVAVLNKLFLQDRWDWVPTRHWNDVSRD